MSLIKDELKVENILGEGGIISRKLKSYESRVEQIEMARAIEKAISGGKHLIVEAGTGIGKSLAYLVPFLQQQLVEKDLPFLKDALELDFQFALSLGSQNYLCLRRLNQARSYGLFETRREVAEISKIFQWEIDSKTGLRQELDFEPSGKVWGKVSRESDLCLGKSCFYKDQCYYNKARLKEFESQIIVVNHHLYFANLASGGRVLPNFEAVVFDEAQNLEEVATNYLGIEISNDRIRFLLDSIFNPRTGKGLLRRISRLEEKERKKIENLTEEVRALSRNLFSEVITQFGKESLTRRIREKNFIPNLLKEPLASLSLALSSLSSLSGNEEEKLELTAFSNRCQEIKLGLNTIIEQKLEGYVYWLEITEKTRGTKCTLQATPLNIAHILKEELFEAIRPVVLTSATLSTNNNFEYLKGRLGFEEGDELLLASPFDYPQNVLLYLPRHMPDPNLEFDLYQDKVTEEVKNILEVSGGRAFVLFTSFEMLEKVYRKAKRSLCSYKLFRQGDKPRYRLVEEFKRNRNSVLFGTYTFWQGIDIPGKALECVIISKLPFAVPDEPVTEAKMEKLAEERKDPFIHYQVPQAIILLKQGFGRLLRTKKDRGIVAILDPRLKTRFYGKMFLSSLPHCREIANLEEIKKFFS
jgi:ATP-dependent DNA helicase DinG